MSLLEAIAVDLVVTATLPGCDYPSRVEQREFPICIRKHFVPATRVYDRMTGKEHVVGGPDSPHVFEVVCGLSGGEVANYEIREDLTLYEEDRLIVRDTPIPGKTATLDCYEDVTTQPDLPRWEHFAWFPTDDGLYCRVPRSLRGRGS